MILFRTKNTKFVKEPENPVKDKVYHDELILLQKICDDDIALHSVELATQVCM